MLQSRVINEYFSKHGLNDDSLTCNVCKIVAFTFSTAHKQLMMCVLQLMKFSKCVIKFATTFCQISVCGWKIVMVC